MHLSLLRKMSSLLLNNYELVLKSKYLGKIPVDVYRSQRTGLHVALAQAPGPTVNCNIVLATEIKTDDGLPHTLEHLVFMGSKSYPFKGSLDLLSSKVFAIGSTNAWTEQDHTAYTVKTIGANGMQNFVPIYGDHLINPILNAENYRSEVYHVTDQGEEAGVVYSEIQDHENDLDNLVDIEMSHQVFPTTPSFHSDSGGRMKEVRELCSLKRVQDYHKQFYHLKNMWILLCGTLDAEQMLKSIDTLDSPECNRPPAVFDRPFINMTVPDVTRTRFDSTIVKGPTECEGEGIVQIGFLTRPAWDIEFIAALKVLSSYLTKTTSAPLSNALSLIPDPYCDDISMNIYEYPRCQIVVDFSSVPVEKLNLVADKFFEVLRASSKPEVLEMDRIKYIIEHKIKKLYSKIETDVGTRVFSELIGFQLFAPSLNDQGHFDKLLNPVPTLEALAKKPAEYWSNLIAEIFTDNCAVIIGQPDSKIGEKMAADEAKRLKELKAQVKADSAKRQKLEESKSEEASSCASLKMFDNIEFDPNIPIFNVESSIFSPANSTQNGHSDLIATLPSTTILHKVDSKFLRAYFLFDLTSVPLRLKKYLMLFNSMLAKSPAIVDGKLMSDTDVANLMIKELMEASYGPGCLGSYKHLYHFYIEAPIDEFHLVARWAKILLNDTIFEKDKILAVTKNLANGTSSSKRDGNTMCGTILKSLNTVKEHASRFYSDVVLENFHRSLAKRLEGPEGDEAAKTIISELNELRQAILDSPMNSHLVCNPTEISAPNVQPDAWDFLNFSKRQKSPDKKITIDFKKDVQAYKQTKPASRVLKMDSSDASFIMAESKCEVEYGSAEHVAILIMANYFSMAEGVLWKEIRGNGLAYGAGIGFNPNLALIELDLYRCSRPKLAYQQTKEAVLNIFKENKLDSVLFDLAKRSAIASVMARYETLKGTATLSIFDNLRGKSMEDVKQLAANTWKAGLPQTFELAKPHFMNLFSEDNVIHSVVCPRNKLKEVSETFKGIETVTAADLQYVPE